MRVAHLFSGGVDSSVALHLLKADGHDVTAFYLKIWLEDEVQHLGDCAWEEDLNYVEQTCEMLGVPLQIISMQRQYWDLVVAELISQVQQGLTPNPDIWCNEKVKFGAFYDALDWSEYDLVSTGHYAQVEQRDGKSYLFQAPDAIKDQTYFLSRLRQDQLEKACFPIGHLPKDDVRQIAQANNLPSATRKDSQGICFLGTFAFRDFLQAHLGTQPGDIIEHETGETLGQHDGFYFYTKGQRQGLGLSGGPWFVVAKCPAQNTVTVSTRSPEEVGVTTIQLVDCNWIPTQPEAGTYQMKLRHGPNFVTGQVSFGDASTAEILLEEPQRGVAEGQSVVLYQDGYCLGGGIVS